MKYSILGLAFLFHSFVLSQDNQKRGKFLENQVSHSKTEFKNYQQALGVENDTDIYAEPYMQKKWSNNYGEAEVFLRVLDDGRFSVEIDGQIINNATGKFRFFDLNPGTMPISIYQNHHLIYKVNLHLDNNTRSILEFYNDDGLYLVDVFDLDPYAYGEDEWNYPCVSIRNPHPFNKVNLLRPDEFIEYLDAIEDESFDDDKVDFILSTSQRIYFTTAQVIEIIKKISFDKGRLKVAKFLYHQSIDSKNYYRVYDLLFFSSSKSELKEYILNYNKNIP